MLRDRKQMEENTVGMLTDEVREFARPLNTVEDLDPLMDQIGEAHFVLLGEASHGTSEYYLWRARLSSRLIAEKGFDFVSVEGDRPDCYRLNRYVKSFPGSGDSALADLDVGRLGRCPPPIRRVPAPAIQPARRSSHPQKGSRSSRQWGGSFTVAAEKNPEKFLYLESNSGTGYSIYGRKKCNAFWIVARGAGN